jgi:outer membrane protein
LGPDDLVMVMDADTSLSPRFLEVAHRRLTEDPELTAVGGVSYAPDYLGSKNYEVNPLVGVVLNAGYGDGFLAFDVTSLRLGYRVSSQFSFGMVARYQGGREDVENDRVDRLEDIDEAVHVGAFFRAKPYEWLSVNGEIAQDVTGATDGLIASFGFSTPMPLSERWLLTPSIGVTYYSADFVSRYFGVSAADAAQSGLRAFETEDGALAFSAGLALGYKISERWSAGVTAEYKRLTGEAADSPIVEDEGSADQARVTLGLSYKF